MALTNALFTCYVSFLLMAYSAAIDFPDDQFRDKEAKMYCARPCSDCTDPKWLDWVFIKNDGVHRTVKGQWIKKSYAAGNRYYFLVSREDYEYGLRWCKKMGYRYVQPSRKDLFFYHVFAIKNGKQLELMPGCAHTYPSGIWTCSNE